MSVSIQTFPTGIGEFHRLPSLLTSAESAVLVDGPFFLSSGAHIRDAILATGKRLAAILVTCHDPDFYFGLGPIHAAFPDAPILAPSPIAATIRRTAAQKVAFWKQQHGAEIPAFEDIILPTPFDHPRLALDDETIDIVATPQSGYFHLWLPSVRTILGGVQVSSANHVWMADFPLPAQRADWVAALDAMLALDPIEVLPGHLPPGAPTGITAIRFTRDYIRTFEDELAKASTGEALIAAMTARFPDLAMPFILDLGARVCMGEMAWGDGA